MIRKAGKLFYRLKGYFPVRINGRTFRCDPHHVGFWRIVNRGGFETEFYDILDQYLGPDHTYCDMGSWIGPTVIYAARLCRTVHCFEPDGVAFPYLLQNINLNSLENVVPYPVAIATRDGTVKMASHGGMPGDSMTSMVNIAGKDQYFEAPSLRWETWMKNNQPGKIDFLKVDIEGGEVEVIPAMQDWLKSAKPVLHLSVHGRYLDPVHRREQLGQLFSCLEFYARCMDERMTSVDIGSLAGVTGDSFRSFLFIP